MKRKKPRNEKHPAYREFIRAQPCGQFARPV